jgi:Uncharacterized paraquat-inducible protein A
MSLFSRRKCENCGASVFIQGVEHNQDRICPYCGATIKKEGDP